MRNLGREKPEPEEGGVQGPSARLRAARRVGAVVVGSAGVLAVHHPMILSGFGRIQTDLGDSRLLNYFLEHGWLWASRAPRHESFWDAPFFHPVSNVMAFSDCMISYGPLYWLFRAVGLRPDTAFGAWMVGVTVLNFAAGMLLFRRGLGFGAPAASAAAGLIAFGSPRVNLLHHPQLLPFFYLLFALYALCRIVRDQAPSAVERAGWWSLFGLAVAAQFYGGYYLGWFFGVGLATATGAAVLLPTSRGRVVELARRDGRPAALGAAVAAVALLPFLMHYLPAARELGQDFHKLQHHALPSAWSWWNVGGNNWCWGWIDRRWAAESLYPEELRLGLGFATAAACGLGLSLDRRSPLGRVTLATVLFGVTAMTLPMTYLGFAAACVALAGLFRAPEWTRTSAAAVALTAFVLLTAPAGDPIALSLSFATMAFCLLRLWSRRASSGGWEALGLATALGLHSVPIDLAAPVAGFFATIGGLAVWRSPGRRIETAIAAAGLWLAATAWLAVDRNHSIFHQAALGTIVGWWASGDRRLRLSPVKNLAIVAVALPVAISPLGAQTLWLAVGPFIPGGGVIRMPSRAILVFLVPAALGLALLVERIDRSRWSAAAWCLVMICLAEQTVTTPTFDRDAHRDRVARIADQVDRRAGAFYHPPTPGGDFRYHYHVNLDAMWAALDVGVPTINGVSGCFPAGWEELREGGSPGRLSLDEALQAWRARHGDRGAEVQIVGPRVETP